MKDRFYFLRNNLFTTYTLEVDFPRLYAFKNKQSEAKKAFDEIKALYDKAKFTQQNEHQFEDDFISKTLDILGYSFIRQEEKIIQGKLEKPDFLLFSSLKAKQDYEQIPKNQRAASNAYISVILESKAYNTAIDNKKVKDNPHFQILRYLNNLKLNYGFLSNGQLWRLYDNSKLSATKVFYEINLETLLENDDLEGFNYFYFIFKAENFAPKKDKSIIEKSLEKNDEAKISIEDDLKDIIYGTNGKDSLFELIGERIFARCSEENLKKIYENSLYFIFRLLFIAYFEDKFSELLKKHEYFESEMSLKNLHSLLKSTDKKEGFKGFKKLSDIFIMYDKGEANYNMPVFNGGLFDSTKTPLLSTPLLFNDEDLEFILAQFLYFDDGTSLFKRDYKTLSIAHLGTIYEGLLGYFFELASEDLYYVKYQAKNEKQKEIESYVDGYDYAELQKTKAKLLSTPKLYKKGQLYLKNSSNSRKMTASYYTPYGITSFLLKEGLKDRLNDGNILHFKILDNACGSGHFLIEALNQITSIILENFDSFANLKRLYEEEKKEIQSSACLYLKDYELDESEILKRLLLKRVIFGVDLNPFSVELTKLSLWIDSFIFGTPLSFIEHHIKCGNALVGASLAEFNDFYEKSEQKNLFNENFFQEKFKTLKENFNKLDRLSDSTDKEIAKSKELYKKEIEPSKESLNLYLNFFTAQKMMPSLKELKKITELDKLESSKEQDYKRARELVTELALKFGFFNYEIEFPETVQDGKFIGFDLIVGNPPWDKCEFSDDDFFSQFKSNYRTLKKSKKAEFKTNQLAKNYIFKDYQRRENFSKTINEYYKGYYFLSRSSESKDLNLFRFFVERNLSLLAKEASLNYVLPSALMFEDGSFNLRKEILQNKTLSFFYSFENREGIFNEVHRSYKFALMQIKNTQAPKNHPIKTMFYKSSLKELYKEENIILLDLKSIKALSPKHLALQEVRNKEDLRLLEKCYGQFLPLNLEWLDFRNELNMTTDKDLFIELEENLSEKNSQLLPLFEGKMIHQFNSEYSKANYYLDKDAFDERLKSKEIYRLKQDLNLDSKEYKRLLEGIKPKNLDTKEFENSLLRYDRDYFRLGFRDIARDTDEFSGIFSLLPKNVGCGHTMWVHIPKKYILNSSKISIETVDNSKICFALGLFNSLIVNFIIRGMVQIHLNKTYLKRIPLPQPDDEEIKRNKDYNFIAKTALILELYNDSKGAFSELGDEFGIKKSELPATQKLYDELRARLDIKVARLYGLSYEDFIHIISTFKVLNKNQPEFIALLKSLWQEEEE
ncbi:Eco57I restriction-modification methylase domain-containing protein [Campylobacter troglodytis]|uniref:Eco57I restriction-modification methylase domain-containing protein n=1 Tax=Campylobacter troglodytis TaxID=654363 RepID=UPI00115C1D69|nr:class I SAM-dependent DNA methyltransferase [Campylobacter troglodytis]TQR53701.1 restriction endonuclease [Campylobacter troglodytis]